MHPEIEAVLNGDSQWCLVQGDCRKILPTLQDKCVDCAITDPPYGLNLSGGTWGAKFDDIYSKWDNETVDLREIFRVSRNQIIWGGNYYSLPPTRGFIVWDKGPRAYKKTFAECDFAWTSFDVPARKVVASILDESHFHYTQKPIKLMEFCVNKYTGLDSLIIDPYCGSGTTGVAAVSMGRRFIGIELDERWIARAKHRIDSASRQQRINLSNPGGENGNTD